MIQLLNQREADKAFDDLKKDLKWERREGAPRSEYWTNCNDQSYTYGRGAGERTYQAQNGHPWIDWIDARLRFQLTGELKKWFEYYYEGCFLNMYLDGSDALGWHADDDPGIDHSRPIAIVSLGASRTLQTKAQVSGSHPTSHVLDHGSLFLMPAGFQQTHLHRIVRDPKIEGTRISLTFRGLK